jgi:hypothetical protein
MEEKDIIDTTRVQTVDGKIHEVANSKEYIDDIVSEFEDFQHGCIILQRIVVIPADDSLRIYETSFFLRNIIMYF